MKEEINIIISNHFEISDTIGKGWETCADQILDLILDRMVIEKKDVMENYNGTYNQAVADLEEIKNKLRS